MGIVVCDRIIEMKFLLLLLCHILILSCEEQLAAFGDTVVFEMAHSLDQFAKKFQGVGFLALGFNDFGGFDVDFRRPIELTGEVGIDIYKRGGSFISLALLKQADPKLIADFGAGFPPRRGSAIRLPPAFKHQG